MRHTAAAALLAAILTVAAAGHDVLAGLAG